jgi:serine/threonine protein kinase
MNMTSPTITAEKFLELVKRSGLVQDVNLENYAGQPTLMASSQAMASALIKAGILTNFQAKLLMAGKYRGLMLGNYKLLEQIGRGGMGTVYLAEHMTLKRKAAVKVLASDQATTTIGTERFYREAQSAAALDHPNIVKVYDVGQYGNVHYIAMEYVEGQTLAQLIEKNGPLHFATAADYIAQASAGLQEAGDKGFVHRDIKPENLIVDRQGTLKILDMGLTRHADDEGGSRLTAVIDPNSVVGTPDYIAPEQALNLPVDIRTDIYSLGVTFFALLTGKPPFNGTTAQKLLQHQLKEAPSLGALRTKAPPEIEPIIATMMAKKPEDRFQQPSEIIEVLAPWLSEGGGSSHNTKTITATRSRLTSRIGMAPPANKAKPKWMIPAIAMGVGLLLFGGAFGIYSAVSGGNNSTAVTTPSTSGTSPQASTTPPPANKPPVLPGPNELPPLAANSILVASEGPEPRFATIAEAIASIKGGEKKTIVVRNPVHAEQLILTGPKYSGITIESGFPKNLVTWQPPTGASDKPLLELNGVEGIRIRGFKFDGQGRVSDTVRIAGKSPDLVLEESAATGFTRSAVDFFGASGTEERTVTLKKFRTIGGGDNTTGVLLESGQGHAHIRIIESRFEGPLGAAITVSGGTQALEIRRNRFYRARQGVLYKPNGSPVPMMAQIRTNTFAETPVGIEFTAIPPNLEDNAANLSITDNLFVNAGRMASLVGAPLAPENVPGWYWHPEAEKTTTIPAGKPRYFRRVFNLAALPTGPATLNVGADESFTVWLNGKEIGKSSHNHFSQRVYAFDASKDLLKGDNVLAVQAVNELDPFNKSFGTAAGFLVQLTETLPTGKDKDIVTVDTQWKAGTTKDDDWLSAKFDDAAWPAARLWNNTNFNLPWRETVWDSTVDKFLKTQPRKFRATVGGNVRDYFSLEGYPVLESKRTTLTTANKSIVGLDVDDDETFLRYPATHAMINGGVQQGPVGVPPSGY